MEPPLGRRLYLSHRAVHDALDARLAERGASLWHWVLLREAALADGASQRALAQQMHIEPPSLVRQLDTLAADGLIERRPDPDDRRVSRVHVTAAGRKRLTELNRVAQRFDGELRGALGEGKFTEAEIDRLGDALLAIHVHFAGADPIQVAGVRTTRGA
ncbi:MAG: MarR family transcriptional regulator [Acidimicrobiia bacterium]